jgi:hypothetical protein
MWQPCRKQNPGPKSNQISLFLAPHERGFSEHRAELRQVSKVHQSKEESPRGVKLNLGTLALCTMWLTSWAPCAHVKGMQVFGSGGRLHH